MHAATTSDVTHQLNRTHGSFELVLSPVILALLGWWLDGRFGTGPWLVIVFAVLGLLGAVTKIVTGYGADMAKANAERPGPAGERATGAA